MTTREVVVETALGPAEVHVTRPRGVLGTLVLTHGANGAMTTPDLLALGAAVPDDGWALALVRQAWAVAGKRMPPTPPVQDAAWRPVVEALRSGRSRLPGPLVLGGRSNGARVACRTAPDLGADGVLCLAFPLHPPGNPARSRADELIVPAGHGIPLRVVQGATDAFGTPTEVRAALPDPAVLVEVAGGHGFTRRPTAVVAAVLDFLSERVGRPVRE